jgi:hypothetical protein
MIHTLSLSSIIFFAILPLLTHRCFSEFLCLLSLPYIRKFKRCLPGAVAPAEGSHIPPFSIFLNSNISGRIPKYEFSKENQASLLKPIRVLKFRSCRKIRLQQD